MSSSLALNVAKSSLQTTGVQTSISSRNVANGGEAYYSRKNAVVVTGSDGSAHVVSIQRATDTALFKTMLKSTSAASAQQALLDGLQKLSETINDPELEQSPAAKLGDLTNKLQQYAAAPDNSILAQAVLGSANEMVATLNQSTATVQATRASADIEMSASVERINGLLAKFETVNNAIIKGTVAGTDITDQLDTRDSILAQLSDEIGISVVGRENNDTVIYTDGGVTLFESRPRDVTFTPSTVYDATTAGNAVYVDGVAVVGGASSMPSSTGRLFGLATLRDETTVTYQNQLDEIARGLIEAFAEADQSGGGGLDLPGIFTYPGGDVPPTSILVQSLAGTIRVSAAIDPAQGGDLDRIRDGGINGVDYVYNVDALAGFADRLNGLIQTLGQPRVFDPLAGGDPSNTLAEFATSSVSWLEFNRQQVDNNATYQMTMYERSSEALSNATGVNLDDELAGMLELERTYGASSKLIAAVDRMLQDLLDAV